MPHIIDITGHPLIPLEKEADGNYPYPRTRYGILPYCVKDAGEIVWGCVESNRVEPITFEPAAGTQDIIVLRGDKRWVLESGKPFPDFNQEFSFLSTFIGMLFRDGVYQDSLSCLVANGFSVYLENPLATAIHEAYEEHGIDLHIDSGRDNHLLKTPLELTQREIFPAQKGVASPLHLWLAELTDLEGIKLRQTNKVDKKMRRNFGREFYEKGTWITLDDFKKTSIDQKSKFFPLDIYSPVKAELISQAFSACDRNIQFIEKIESSLPKRLYQKPLENTALIFPSQSDISPIGSQRVFDNPNAFFSSATGSHETHPRTASLVCSCSIL